MRKLKRLFYARFKAVTDVPVILQIAFRPWGTTMMELERGLYVLRYKSKRPHLYDDFGRVC